MIIIKRAVFLLLAISTTTGCGKGQTTSNHFLPLNADGLLDAKKVGDWQPPRRSYGEILNGVEELNQLTHKLIVDPGELLDPQGGDHQGSSRDKIKPLMFEDVCVQLHLLLSIQKQSSSIKSKEDSIVSSAISVAITWAVLTNSIYLEDDEFWAKFGAPHLKEKDKDWLKKELSEIQEANAFISKELRDKHVAIWATPEVLPVLKQLDSDIFLAVAKQDEKEARDSAIKFSGRAPSELKGMGPLITWRTLEDVSKDSTGINALSYCAAVDALASKTNFQLKRAFFGENEEKGSKADTLWLSLQMHGPDVDEKPWSQLRAMQRTMRAPDDEIHLRECVLLKAKK